MQENEERMKEAWNLEDPIENVFFQIEEGAEYARHGNAPLTTNQVLNIAYVLMAQAHIFKEACRDWRRLPQENKT